MFVKDNQNIIVNTALLVKKFDKIALAFIYIYYF